MAVKRMQQRQDTSANWSSANPVLLAGEIGYETDTKKYKVGDGSTPWNELTSTESYDTGDMIYSVDDTREGYLRCDGSSYLLSAYPALGALIGSIDSHTYTTTVSGIPTLPSIGHGCSFSPDGTYLVCCSDGISVYTVDVRRNGDTHSAGNVVDDKVSIITYKSMTKVGDHTILLTEDDRLIVLKQIK